jgi:hypothetical protein
MGYCLKKKRTNKTTCLVPYYKRDANEKEQGTMRNKDLLRHNLD